MRFFKSKTAKSASSEISEKMAATIASQLLHTQKRLADPMNQWFNSLSVQWQKLIAFTCALVVAAWLLTGLLGDYEAFPSKSRAPYSVAHIGRSSDSPKPQPEIKQHTDSLTIK